ncbi:Swi5-domain-containing protein [Chaetomium tenue]|uniref:Swi5-domain-containing protein n=1 Tax=Chaetomium tenue TaxID=1854479 RepID=A0ACB7PIC4_9PEZI|nr:Swi5-domain-containing protein [Chaetomium globosum]
MTCDGFRLDNLMFKSEDDLTVVGVVDLEWSYIGPPQLAASAPWWLLRDCPVHVLWDYVNGEPPAFTGRYFKNLELYKRLLREEEAIRQGPEDKAFSELVQWSEDSGAMWLHMLFTFGVGGPDAFPLAELRRHVGVEEWKALEEQVDDDAMEVFAEEKSMDLKQYHADLEAIRRDKAQVDSGELNASVFLDRYRRLSRSRLDCRWPAGGSMDSIAQQAPSPKMSRQTPRKSRHRHHASNSGPRQVAASDYESDAAQYMENRETMPLSNAQPARDNTELSLRVLRRYQPSIRSIMAIAANAVAYNFLEATQGMENLVIDLLRVTDCEVVGELIVFRLEDGAVSGNSQGADGTAKKILGLWIHADESNTREVHASLILGAWKQGRQALDAYIQAVTVEAMENNGNLARESYAVAVAGDSATGKRLTAVPHHMRSLDPALCQASPSMRAHACFPTEPSIKMATDSNDVRIGASSSYDSDDAIGIAIRTQTSLATSFQQWLTPKKHDDGDRHEVIARVQSRLDSYKQWLQEVNTVPINVLGDVEPWDMSARVQPGDEDGSVILVTGPGSGEPIEIAAKNERELRYLMSCNAFAKSQDTLRLLLRTSSELQDAESELSQPPDATVKTYIRRLQEYNDIKDIGQQLIGFIAENRGVSVRTIYEQGEFGVSYPQ